MVYRLWFEFLDTPARVLYLHNGNITEKRRKIEADNLFEMMVISCIYNLNMMWLTSSSIMQFLKSFLQLSPRALSPWRC